MIKSVLFILIIASVYSCFSQTRNKPFALYSTIGLKSGLGLSTIYNANMSSDENLEYNSSLNYSFGFKTSLSYIAKKPINSIFGIQVEYMLDNFALKCPLIENNLGDYSKEVTFKTKSVVILGRYTNVSRRIMVEIGSQLTKFHSINVHDFGIHPNHAYYSAGFNYKENYKNYASLVFGLGIFTKYFNVSLRQSYSMSSMTRTNCYPVKDGFYNHEHVNPEYEKSYNENKPTMIYTAQITVEYYIPFIKFKRYWRGKKELSIFQPVKPVYYWGESLN